MGELIAVLFRVLVLVVIFSLVRSLFRSIVAGFRSAQQPPANPPAVQAGGDLKKDPVCGTYVSTAASLMRTVKGQTYYFCSPECRDRYAAK
jgi:uncharacterized protein